MKSQAQQVAFTVALVIAAAFGGFRTARIMDSAAAQAPVQPSVHAAAAAEPIDGDGSLCAGKPEETKMDCYRAAFVQDIAIAGMDSAFAALRAFVQSDSDVKRDVHMYAHGIGIDAFRLKPNVVSTFSHCTPEFSSGCYHGVMQAYFELKGTDDPAVIRGGCHAFDSADRRWMLFQCLHGMGHGLDMTLDHDLPRALHGCDMLDDEWMRQSCYGGVFMENITNTTEPDAPGTMMASEREQGMSKGGKMGSQMGSAPRFRPFDRTDPLYPCSVVAAIYGPECYKIQTTLILYLNGSDLKATAKACDKAPTQFQASCYQSLGRDIVAYADYEPAKAVHLCGVGRASLRGWCYVGVAKTLVDERANLEPGLAICKGLTNPEYRSECITAMGELLLTLIPTPAERERVCALPSEADRRDCRAGAQLDDPRVRSVPQTTAARAASTGA